MRPARMNGREFASAPASAALSPPLQTHPGMSSIYPQIDTTPRPRKPRSSFLPNPHKPFARRIQSHWSRLARSEFRWYFLGRHCIDRNDSAARLPLSAMAKKIKATKTINPLHFEALDPHRFEDLVRRLLYGF